MAIAFDSFAFVLLDDDVLVLADKDLDKAVCLVELVVLDVLLAVVADGDRFVVLDEAAAIFLRVFVDEFLTLLVLEHDLVETIGPSDVSLFQVDRVLFSGSVCGTGCFALYTRPTTMGWSGSPSRNPTKTS
jgi:hypothetical protein